MGRCRVNCCATDAVAASLLLVLVVVLEPFAGLALANSFQLNDFISTTRATFATDALDIEHPHRWPGSSRSRSSSTSIIISIQLAARLCQFARLQAFT